MLAPEGGDDPFRDPSIDHLKLLQEAGMVKQIEQDPFERQGLQVALPQFSDGDVAYERGCRVDLGVLVVEPIHILDQGEALATETFGQQEGARVAAMRGDSPKAGRMLPERVGRHPGENRPGPCG